MATTTDTMNSQLAALEDRVKAASAKEREIEAAARTATRMVAAAEMEEASHHEAVAAGDEDEDPKKATRLSKAVQDAREAAASHIWEGRVTGARRAREQAEQERDAFAVENFGQLVAEEIADDIAARDWLQETYEAFEEAQGVYAARLRRHERLARAAGHDLDDIPGLPTRGDVGEVASRFVRGIDVPAPRSLLPGA